MCVPLAAAAIAATVASGGYSAYTQYQNRVSQNKYYQYLSDNSKTEANYAIKQGDAQSTAIQNQAKEQGKQLSSNQSEFNASQKVAMAASGVQGVTAEDISNSTFNKEQLDKTLLRHNADTKSWESNSNAAYKAWSLNTEANNYNYAGKSALAAGRTQSFTTLLSTAASVAAIGALAPGAATTLKAGSGFSNTTIFNPANLALLK